MKRLRHLPALAAFVLFLAPLRGSAETGIGEVLSISVTNSFGDVFTNLTVTRVLGDGLLLKHKVGELKIKFEKLPEDVQTRYASLAKAAAERDKQQATNISAFVASQPPPVADSPPQRDRDPEPLPEDMVIGIPTRGWNITVLNPHLVQLTKRSFAHQFSYTAMGDGGFNLSIFVELPGNGGKNNDDVYRYYWAQASRNPLIDQKSVRMEPMSKFVKVSYTSANIPNVNYYFVYGRRWVDVHISSDGDGKKLFALFQDHLAYADEAVGSHQ